jgi:dTDP-4-amino-4,6-dideoxygalactose transaminase
MAMKIPLLDLQGQYAPLREEAMRRVDEVLKSGNYILGPWVKRLEERIAKLCGTKHAIACASGTDALILSLKAIGIGPGDEVIVPTFTFFASAGAVSHIGGRPVFVDILPDTYNMDPKAVEAALTPRTKAIMPVHLFGQSADMEPILEVARKRSIAVVEDAAQSLGARWRDRPAGSIGRVGCFSFYPTKNLGGYGDGGMITTNDDALADLIRRLRVHGAKPKYFHAIVGMNSRLDEIQATLLDLKLDHLESWTAARRANAAYYDRELRGGPFGTPVVREGCFHVYNQYTIAALARESLIEHLKTAGVGTGIYYPLSLHLQGCFQDLGYREGSFPVAEEAQKTSLSLPVYPELKPEEKEHVVKSLLSFVVREGRA